MRGRLEDGTAIMRCSCGDTFEQPPLTPVPAREPNEVAVRLDQLRDDQFEELAASIEDLTAETAAAVAHLVKIDRAVREAIDLAKQGRCTQVVQILEPLLEPLKGS
jgi:hypothetical protein